MSQTTIDAPSGPGPDGRGRPPRPRRGAPLGRVLIGLALLVVILVGVGTAWWFLARDEAEQVTTDGALDDFRNSGASGSESGGPPVGVYTATATGTEDVGFPGLTESLGPNAPV